MRIRLIQMPYRGERNAPDISSAPAYLDDEVLRQQLATYASQTMPSVVIALTPDQDEQYGEWNRVALANRHMATAIAEALSDDVLPIGLLANCNALLGMLAGLQQATGSSRPRTIGLIWIDAHADFNTPETTLSGMLGGMPVAASTGLCLHRLRQTSGMTSPISTEHIIMCGLRDVDRLEQDLLDEHHVTQLSIDDLQSHQAVHQLFQSTDAVYVHVDMDVLDPVEVSGHPLTVPGGPTSEHLAKVLGDLFRQKCVEALGIASTPPQECDTDGRAKAAAHRLICASAQGITDRSPA